MRNKLDGAVGRRRMLAAIGGAAVYLGAGQAARADPDVKCVKVEWPKWRLAGDQEAVSLSGSAADIAVASGQTHHEVWGSFGIGKKFRVGERVSAPDRGWLCSMRIYNLTEADFGESDRLILSVGGAQSAISVYEGALQADEFTGDARDTFERDFIISGQGAEAILKALRTSHPTANMQLEFMGPHASMLRLVMAVPTADFEEAAGQMEDELAYREDALSKGLTFEDTCCYLTTAACTAMALPDDCRELRTLRWYRDVILRNQPDGATDIARYYASAPRIVERLRRNGGADCFRALYAQFIVPACALIDAARYDEAYALYRAMVERLEGGEIPAL